jgi:hypothetical protein
MKLIRQISTGKTVYREEPHHEKALVNGSLWTGIDVSDLEVHTQELTEEQYDKLLQDETPYSDKRKAEYAKLNQFEMQFDDQRDSTSTWVDAVNAIKLKFPKPE